MKVKELKQLLDTFNEDDEVVLSKDSEGNGFSPLSGTSQQVYVPETTWYGSIYEKEITEEMRKEGYSEEDTYQGNDGINAVVLWPIN